MDWTRGHIVIAVGAIVNSALYLTFVAVAGLIWGDTLATVLAIAAMGITFLSYSTALIFGATRWKNLVAVASWLVGIAAGSALLVGRLVS